MFLIRKNKHKNNNKSDLAQINNDYDFYATDRETQPIINFMRCTSCSLIPFFYLNSETHEINIHCEAGHNNNISLNEYMKKYFNQNKDKINCSTCDSKLNSNAIYCKECASFLCEKCSKYHKKFNETKTHHVISIKKYDTTCMLHFKTFCAYCKKCKKNLCSLCKNIHEHHELFIFNENYIKNLNQIKENLQKEKNYYSDVEKIFRKLILEIQSEFINFFEQKEIENNFKSNIINCYETYKENYYIIQNINALSFENKPFIIDNTQNSLYNLEQMFNYLNKNNQKIFNDIYTSNSAKKNVKFIKEDKFSRNINSLETSKTNNQKHQLISYSSNIKNMTSSLNSHEDNYVNYNNDILAFSSRKENIPIKLKKKISHPQFDNFKTKTAILHHKALSSQNKPEFILSSEQIEKYTEQENSDLNKYLYMKKNPKNTCTFSRFAKIENSQKDDRTERSTDIVNKIKSKIGLLYNTARDKKIYTSNKKNVENKIPLNNNAFTFREKDNNKEIKNNDKNNNLDIKNILSLRSQYFYSQNESKYDTENINELNNSVENEIKTFKSNASTPFIKNEKPKQKKIKKQNSDFKKKTKHTDKKKEMKIAYREIPLNFDNNNQNDNSQKQINLSNEKEKTVINSILKRKSPRKQISESNVNLQEENQNSLKSIAQNKMFETEKFEDKPNTNRNNKNKKISKKEKSDNDNISTSPQTKKNLLSKENKKKLKKKQLNVASKEKEIGTEKEDDNNKNDKNCDKNDSKVLESSKNDVYIDINKNKNLNSKKKKKKSKIIIFNNINEDKTDIKTSDNKNINKNETKNITKNLSKTNIKKDDSNNNILSSIKRHKKILPKRQKKSIDSLDTSFSFEIEKNKQLKNLNNIINISINNNSKNIQETEHSNSQKSFKDLIRQRSLVKRSTLNISDDEDNINNLSNNPIPVDIQLKKNKHPTENFFNKKFDQTILSKIYKNKIQKNIFNKIGNNSFNLTNKKNTISKKKTVISIDEYDNSVCSMVEMHTGNFACGFLYGEIDIYDKTIYDSILTIEEHESRVCSLNNMKDDRLLSCSFDGTMKKFHIFNNNYQIEFIFKSYDNIVYKGIELSNSDVVSISNEGRISIWINVTNSYIKRKIKKLNNESLFDIKQISENSLVISTDCCLRFFDTENYENNDTIRGVEINRYNNLVIYKKYIFALLKKEIGIFDANKKNLVYSFDITNGKVDTIALLKNNLLIGVCNNENIKEKCILYLRQYEFNGKEFNLIGEKKETRNKIDENDYTRMATLLVLKNGSIVYGTIGIEDKKLYGNISVLS